MAKRRSVPTWALVLTVLALAGIGLAAGPSGLGLEGLMSAAGLGPPQPVAETILFGLRLPRVLLALVVGAGLATSGALMQAVFRNPLAEPSLVGVSSGAALGAAVVLVFASGVALPAWLEAWSLPLAAALGGAGTVRLVQAIARKDGATSTATLLLAGLAITSLVNALLGLALHLASDSELRSLTFWMLGSLAGSSPAEVGVAALLVLVPLGFALRIAAPLDALLLGAAEARHLGVDVERLERRCILLASIMVGASVAVSGVIGFVGLLVPHLVRFLVGPGHRQLLPRVALGGAGLLVVADAVARSVAAPLELPIGILTAVLGAPFFVYLLMRRRSFG